jgi:ribosome-binding factor A
MPPAFKRAERVGQAVQEELGRMLLMDLKDPRIGRATITRVRVTDDLRQARAFVSLAGDPAGLARALEGLRSAAGFVRGELARRLNLRYAPEVVFEADEMLDEMQRLGDLMRSLHPPEEGEDTP